MAARIPEKKARELIKRVEEALRKGGKPPGAYGPGKSAVEVVADEMIQAGEIRTRSAIRHKLEAAKEHYNLEPDWDEYRPTRYHQHPPKFPGAIIKPVLPEELYQEEETTVLCIPDMHQCPKHPHRREVLTWAARHGSQHKFDRVIQLGDWNTFDSVSRHERNETYGGRSKPTIEEDLANFEESLKAWNRGRDPLWKPKQRVVEGNHEDRLFAYENNNPETWGTYTDRMRRSWLNAGWKTHPYGEILYADGVAFSHAPLGTMGRPITGKTAGARVSNELTVDYVHGHTHRFSATRVPKIGHKDSVLVIEAGCALPWGEIEPYAAKSMTGWWWGVVELTIRGGEISDWRAVSMKTLRLRYSDDGADIRSAA